MLTSPHRITGLTAYCRKKYLDQFLVSPSDKQPFELYEGPSEFLPINSPVFIFQVEEKKKNIKHGLKAIARFIGYFEIDGWKKPGETIADKLLKIYENEGIISHDTREELIEFCNEKDGVRGVFVFDRIIEIKYKTDKDWIRKKDVTKIFDDKQPYAQGFPYRYLSEEMTNRLIQLILERASNSDEIREFLKRNFKCILDFH